MSDEQLLPAGSRSRSKEQSHARVRERVRKKERSIRERANRGTAKQFVVCANVQNVEASRIESSLVTIRDHNL